MAYCNFICLLLCFLFSSTFISTSSSKPITLELSPIPNPISSQNPKEIITDLVKSTLQRARHLKIQTASSSKSTYSTPLFAQGTGAYSISLSLGTPPQKISVFFDTGSSFVWVPCTSHYLCSNCTQNNAKITTFLPQKSSSKHSVKCNDKKCRWLDQPNVRASCPTCARSFPSSCSKPCSYIQSYGSGETSGNAIFEKLNLQTRVVPSFFVGCSLMTDILPFGIAGFGRNPMSFPNLLKLSKFSYCLISHKFDDTLKSSKLVLGDTDVIPGIKYTPLLKNPPMFPFNQYYYVQLKEIAIGGTLIKMTQYIQVPDSKGNGGTIVDSGSTMTALALNVFNPVVEQFVDQMPSSQRKQVGIVPFSIGNVLCMDVAGKQKPSFPKVVFQFKGGVKIDLTVDNYIKIDQDIVCLPFVNTTFAVGQGGSGPAIILGNYQQQNFHIEYDLKNQRFGLKKQNCG